MTNSIKIPLKASLLAIRSHITLFLSYYFIAVIVMTLKGELFNVALRVWSDEPLTFWENGLWQVTLVISFVIALYVYIEDVTRVC
ncbi:hypothetical protein LRP50_08705 [Enterovibrio sp. ZSDZ42]|uniref:Uncharacterized protein n=1 Tax=Enterovibrio gelatinilyticus TaxID=2899819 RepID=A0ABT5QYW6_9GAMM|nr:hypothetical protein [Enterovibrio sp. ZSDZ42]MDD1793203.1 hypothetical protein [Enterovibrio sp. ZSDZ42]